MSDKYDSKNDPRVSIDDSGRTTVVLDYPVETKDGVLKSVTMRRPNVADVEAADAANNDISRSVMLVASLSGLTKVVVKQMDASDFTRCSMIVGEFIAGKK